MDLTAPIDITAVIGAVTAHKDLLIALDLLTAKEYLQHCTAIPGVTNSITLGKVENGTISSKYTGVFLGDKDLGKVVPRTLTVYPVVAEMSDEPERYRRSYIADVKGKVDAHPFEVWIIQHGINLASEDLYNALGTAKYSAGANDKAITDSFDSHFAIIEAEKLVAISEEVGAAKKISAGVGNLKATGALTRANIGDKLLEMWRAMPLTFRRKANCQMVMSEDLGNLYDDWYKDEHTYRPLVDTTGQQILEGSNGKCKIVRVNNMPDGSQLVLLTTKENMVYGYDKESDLTSMMPFPSGNPYKFTATQKYVFGCQFVSIHPSEFLVNDQPLIPA